MRVIHLSKGYVTLVDDEDYDSLNQFKWYAQPGGRTVRAMRRTYGSHAERKPMMMHRIIMNCPEGKEVDHIDHNALNNTKANLRICDRIDNARNVRNQIQSVSKYKGVTYCKQTGRWQSKIRLNGTLKFLGRYDTEEEAAFIYNQAAIKAYGEFACINIFPMSNKLNINKLC